MLPLGRQHHDRGTLDEVAQITNYRALPVPIRCHEQAVPARMELLLAGDLVAELDGLVTKQYLDAQMATARTASWSPATGLC